MPQVTDIKSKLEEIPVTTNLDPQVRATIQRNQDAIWNRLNNLEARLGKVEN